jgi:GABA permease
VRNPFRSEADAFRFVWLTIGYFALIVLGSVINSWLGLAVFLVLTAAAIWLILRRGEPEASVAQAPAESPAGEYRILVVANETVGGAELLAEVRTRSAGKALVLVVCPALNSPLRHGVSDEDEARAAAHARLDQSLASMRESGLEVTGEIGDGDPIQAIEDALRTFQPDELIISTHPAGRSHWLERGVVEKARERFALRVTHVVVDLDA